MLHGFMGEIGNVKIAPENVTGGVNPLAGEIKSRDINLEEMARWGRNYLIHNVVVEHGYKPRFLLNLLEYPIGTKHCVWDTGDIDARTEWAFQYTREMTGSEESIDVEDGIRKRVFGYVRDDGLCWIPYPDTGDMVGVLGRDDTFCFPWTTGKSLVSAIERYRITGDTRMKDLARRIFKGLKNLATHKGDLAYYDGGNGFYQDGKWYGINSPALGTLIGAHHCVTEPVARYYEITHDEEALEFGLALARGIMKSAMPGLTEGFSEDGSFRGHTHLHTYTIWGVAHIATITGDKELLDYARRVYEFVRSKGADFGWFPEIIPEYRPEIRPHSETCIVADMADISSCFARSGLTYYWDHVERYVRNSIRETQFFITPEYEETYRRVHHDKPDNGELGLNQAKLLQGGFISLYPVNDQMMELDKTWLLQNLKDAPVKTTGEITLELNMGGCCPPEGIRALHLDWVQTITEKPEGIFVNLSFDRENKSCKFISFLPEKGLITIVAKEPKDFSIRVPSWIVHSEVNTFRNCQSVKPVWIGDYIKFPQAKIGEVLTITYPLISFIQKLEVGDYPRKEKYLFYWLGNILKKVEPQGKYMPMFTGLKNF